MIRNFLFSEFSRVGFGASSRPPGSPQRRDTLAGRVGLLVLVVSSILITLSFAQSPVLTSRDDNARTGAYTSETLLTPSNVSKNSFGHLYSTPVDYVVMAQPLYLANVNIPGQGTHNVVYVVTQADSVYAIDADNGTQLWYASMLNVGGTTASGQYLPCGTGTGFSQEGIPGTPVIDPNTGTLYLVAKTVLNGTVRHHIHALDITTGSERAGSPMLITAQSTSNKGHLMVFNSKFQKNRPGLLLANGNLYIGFGSNLCNGNNSGWVLSYDATNLSQLGVFNTSPDYGLVSIWQSGNGLAADSTGNLFVQTAEAGPNGYDVPNGGQTYCNSMVKLAPDLSLADYFTPWSVGYLNVHDLDVSSAGALILPDQDGPYVHEVIGGGKQGVVYVLNRDNMGLFSTNDNQALQEYTLVPNATNDVIMSSPAYWNNTVYFAPKASPLVAFPLSSGLLGTPVATSSRYTGAHSPSISANGNTNGIMWVISGPQLLAFDAVSMKLLYGSNQAPNGRDRLPALGHFATQTVANGKVYVATQNSLEAYALFHQATITGGNGQSAPVTTALPVPLQVVVANPYNGQLDVGVTVNFSDDGKGGSFNPASVVTDQNGRASTTYTLPQKAGTYALEISGTGFGTVNASATGVPAAATRIVAYGGSKQTGSAGSVLSNPLVAQVQDAFKNGVPGVTVTFTATKGGVPNPVSELTDSTGFARTSLQLPTTVATVSVSAASGALKKATFSEYAVAGPATTIAVTGGNNQSALRGTQLPQPLTVLVTDQYGNAVSGASVIFSDAGAGGTFSNPNPVITGSNGVGSEFYTLPSSGTTITISASTSGVANPAVFNETSQ
jgi:outer membrane protein assembly factor BamB